MKKADVVTYYDSGRRYPAVNVKHHLWVPDLVKQFKGNGTHEFSDDEGFWAWLEELWDADDYTTMDGPDEWARESCWEMAEELAVEIWGTGQRLLPYDWRIDSTYVGPVKVYSEGRQGGWCVVHGLPPVECWDAIALGQWARFEKAVKQIAHQEYPYQFIWNLGANVWEHIREERRNLYPAPAYV